MKERKRVLEIERERERQRDRLGHTYVKENSAEMRIKCSTVHVKRKKKVIRG